MHLLLRTSHPLRLGVACALAISTVTLGALHPSRAAQAASARAAIVAHVPHVPLRDLGRLATTANVRVGLALKYRNADELEAVIRASSDPASPQYGHFLSPAQFEAAYAPARGDYHRVVSALTAAGFTILASPNHSLVDASAPAAVVERFFGTRLDAVKQDSVRGTRYANVTPAVVPAALRDVVFGVAGLNNLIIAKTQNVHAGRRADLALGPPLQGPDTGLGPYAFASAYGFPVQFSKPGGGTYDGTGHAAGIAIDSDLLDSDLDAYLAYFNVKRSAPLERVLVDGGPNPLINGDGIETNIDTETIAGLAPGASVYLYLIRSLNTLDIIDGYAKVVADDKIDVLNSSFGGCELADDLSVLSDHVAQQGAAEGITFAASSGDSGALQCFGFTPTGLGVSAPASAPHFTAVGGTSLIITPAAAYRLEYAWSGSGGGPSTLFPTPAYQSGIATIIGSTRNLPDVSFDANPGTGLSVYYFGGFVGPYGGTSLSSPIFSAYVTELNEVAAGRSGQINTALYADFKAHGYHERFRDITLGNNQIFGPSYGGYVAGPGYDDVTGIGSANGTPHAY